MAKLPSALDIRPREYRASSPNIRMPAVDYTGIAKGVEAVGQGISALVRSQEEEDGYEVQRRLLDFKLETEAAQEEYRRTMPPGGTGYTQGWSAEYQKRAKAFVGKDDANVPASMRGKIGVALKSFETQLGERAMREEWAERDRKTVEDLNLTLGRTRSAVEANPDRLEEMWAEGKHLIDTSNLPPAVRHKAGSDYREALVEARGYAIINRATDPEGIARAEAELFRPGAQPRAGDAEASSRRWRVFDGATPTAAERRSIRASGGIVVNLDTNWAKGDRPTQPMVVIPDDATPEQRKAAEAYAARVSQLYNEQFGTNLTPKVVTRSQNGRSRNDTIHTEPFSVNDTKAVEFFTSDAGRQAHAEIVRQTLGQIPGVAFSLPHDPTRRGDKGAVGPGGSEVDLARPLLAEITGSVGKASGGTSVTNELYAVLSPSKQRAMLGQLEKRREEVQKAIARQEQERWIDGVLTGTETFNSVSADGRKLIDERIATSGLGDRITEGRDIGALQQAVSLTSLLRYTPKPVAEAVVGKLRSANPQIVAQGYSIIDQLQWASPHALAHVPGYESIIDKALKFRHYSQIYGDPMKAIKQMAADDDPEKKRLRKAVSQDADKFVKDTLTEDKIRGALSRSGFADWFSSPELGATPAQKQAMMSEFREVARRFYEEDPVPELAIAQAANRFRMRHGVSELLGKKRMMAYPPEAFWPSVDGGYAYMTKDLRDTVSKLEPDADQSSIGLQFADWGRDGKPRYWVSWRKKDGRLEVSPRPWAPGYTEANKASETEWQRRRDALIRRQEGQPQDETAPRRRSEGWRFYDEPPGKASSSAMPAPDDESLGNDEWLTVP